MKRKKTIHSLKKKLKIHVFDHPQTKELTILQKETYSFQQEVLNFKAKFLQLENDKEQLQKENNDLILKTVSTDSEQAQQISIDELTKAMSQVTLKDGEIKQLKERNSKIQQENKTLQEKLAKQKTKLMGQVQLQGPKHLLWD